MKLIEEAANCAYNKEECKDCALYQSCVKTTSIICHHQFCKGFKTGAKWNEYNQWINIENEVPPNEDKYCREYFVLFRNMEIQICAWDSQEKQFRDKVISEIYKCNVTHWMYIPKLPLV